MKKNTRDKLTLFYLNNVNTFEIEVIGNSMCPCLQEGDKVYAQKQKLYHSGDIVIFDYKGELLIHRVIAKYDGCLLCKGDNSFAIEQISINSVFGKAIKIEREGNHIAFPYIERDFYRLSLLINQIYCKSNYDVEKTKKSSEYGLFLQKYLIPQKTQKEK